MADTTVTGQFGRESVSLNNAASEATLLRLVAAMEKMNKGSGGRVQDLHRQSQQNQRAYNRELDVGSKALKVTTTAFSTLTTSIVTLSSKIASFAGGIISGTTGIVKDLGMEIIAGGNKLSDFTQHLKDVPLLGLSHGIINFLDEQVSTLNALSMSGASFNNSILAMREAAARAGSDFKQFTEIVRSNTVTMAALGGTVTQGANRFANLSKQFKESDFGKKLIDIGYTVNGVDEALVSFIETSIRGNRGLLKSDNELIETAGKVSLNLDQLAKLTGQNVKDLQKQSQVVQEDFKARLVLQEVANDPTAYANANAALVMFSKEFPKLGPGLMDLAADGIANTPEGQWLKNLDRGGKLQETLSMALKGSLDPQELRERLKAAAVELEQAGSSIVNQRNIDALRLSETGKPLTNLMDGLIELTRINSTVAGAAKTEQDSTNAVTQSLRAFELQMIRLRTEIQNSFFDSQLFDKIQSLSSQLLDSKTIQTITNEISRLTTGSIVNIDKFLKDLDTGGMTTAFKNLFTNQMALVFDLDASKPLQDQLHEKFRSWIADIFSLEKSQSVREQLNQKIKEYIANIFGVDAYKRTVDEDGNEVKDPKSWGDIAGEAFIKKLGEGNVWAVAGAVLGGAIVGYLVYKLGKAILGGGGDSNTGRPGLPGRGRGRGRGNDGDSIGMSLLKGGVGLGVGLAATALGLMAMHEAFEKLEKIDWNKLKDGMGIIAGVGVATGVAAALISLTGPIGMLKMLGAAAIIAALGAALIPYGYAAGLAADASIKFSEALGNVIDKISNYKTAQTDATTRQIKEIAEISPENLRQSATAVESLKNALSGFDKGLLSSINVGLGRLFAPDTATELGKIAALGPSLQKSSEGVESFKRAIVGLDLSGFGMTQEQIAGLRHLQMANLTNLEKIPRVGSNMGDAAQGIKSFKDALTGLDLTKFDLSSDQITRLTNGTNRIKELATQVERTRTAVKNLDETGVQRITTGLKNLSDAFDEFSKSFVDKFVAAFDKTKAESQIGLLNEIKSQLERLNTSAQSINTHTENTSRKVGVTTPPGTVYPQRR